MVNNKTNNIGALVSVIVPVYNVEVYLRRCLESITHQTYSKLEIIIIDDGSTDRSPVICDKYEVEDSRVKVIHQANKGLSAARNVGLDICQGDFVCFVDSDDWIEEDMIEVLLQAILNHSADIVCCGKVVHEARSKTKVNGNKEKVVFEGQHDIIKAFLSGSMTTVAWDKIFKRELFGEDLRYPVGSVYEDLGTIWKVVLRCNRVVCVPNNMYHNCSRKDSITHTITVKNMQDYWCAHIERFNGLYGIDETCNRLLVERCLGDGARIWKMIYPALSNNEKEIEVLNSIHYFAVDFRHMIPYCRYRLTGKISLLFPLINNRISLKISYWCYRTLSKARQLNAIVFKSD